MKTYFNWSTGKDASLALYHLQQNKNYKIERLLTTVNSFYNRVAMHGVRRTLLEQQAASIGIPLTTIELPEQPSMEVYETQMKTVLNELINEGFTTTAFGDIFLEDLRTYREMQLKKLNIQACFPLWKRDTKVLLQEFIVLGFRAVVVCVKAELLDKSFVGREIDEQFIKDLPDNVDCCGENGEFHTFCFDGPIFQYPIAFTLGDRIFKAYNAPKSDKVHNNEKTMGFWFCDLLPC